MSPLTPQLKELLRVAFSDEERAFLEEHPRFQRLLREWDGTPVQFRAIVREGGALIQKYFGGTASPQRRKRLKKKSVR